MRGSRSSPARRQVSMFMLLTALVKVLLYRYSGESDITVGFPIAGREHPDLDGQIGLYANTLVLRSRLHDAQSFTALLDQIRISAAAAYDHQDYPFDQLVQDLNPPRDPSRNPLFDVDAGAAEHRQRQLAPAGRRDHRRWPSTTA